jgi:hypothetical protein
MVAVALAKANQVLRKDRHTDLHKGPGQKITAFGRFRNKQASKLVPPPTTRTRDKTAVFSTRKKTVKKSFTFFLSNK